MKSLLVLLAVISSGFARAQKATDPVLYVFNDKHEPCGIKDAVYLGVMTKQSDTAFQWKYYQFEGPLLSQATFKDENMTMPHGAFRYYGTDGKLDSSGFVSDGLKDDFWFYYTDSFTLWKKMKYARGELLFSMSKEEIDAEAEQLKSQSGALTAQPDEVEAEFKGGPRAWAKYIQRNIKFPNRAIQLNKGGKVIIDFVVEPDGSVQNVQLVQSVEFSIDQEAIRLFRASPKWLPARVDGKPVKAYRRQPLTLRIP